MSSMSNQTINPFATAPKETKKPPQEIGGSMKWDERENNPESMGTKGFINPENFTMEPAAAVREAENIIREVTQSKPASEPNVIYGEYRGSVAFQEDTGTFIGQTQELKIDTTGLRDINISAQDQEAAFAGIFSAGADTIEAAAKTASTIADLGKTTLNVAADTIGKDILGFGQEQPKSPEEIKKANENALQRAHEQKFWANLPVHQPDASSLEALQLGDKVVSKAQFEKAMGIRLTSEKLDERGKLKAGIEAIGERALDDQAKQQEAAAQKANTLTMATKGKGMRQGELDMGTENPNHFTKATG